MKMSVSRWYPSALALMLAMTIAPLAWAEDAESDEPSPQVSIDVSAGAAEDHDTPAMGSEEGEGKAEEQRPEFKEMVQFGRDLVVKEDQEVGPVVVIFASATVEGEVHGDMVVVGGRAVLNGTVHGNLVAPLGTVELGPKAHVEGDCVVVGGSMTADPAAVIDGDRVDVSWQVITEKFPPAAGLWNWVRDGLLMGRLLPPSWGWWWVVALAFGAVTLFAALLFHKPVGQGVEVLQAQPVASFFIGVLVLVLAGPVFLLLAATGIGLLVVPFLMIGLVVAALLGKAVLCRFVGAQVGAGIKVPALARPVAALSLGIVLLYASYMVPVLGCLVWILTAPLGLGAVVLLTARSVSPAPRSEVALQDFGLAPAVAASAAGLGSVPPVIPAGSAGLAPVEMLAMPRAGFWIRFAAAAIDLPLVAVAGGLVGLAPLFLLLWVVYYIGMWTWKGTTLGGVICGLRVVRRDGRPVDFAVALIRCLGCFLSAVALFMGFFWAGWTRERLAWHDIIAGTIVVRVPSGTPLL
jgi:uncharacterized RDD family membrane protein YckC